MQNLEDIPIYIINSQEDYDKVTEEFAYLIAQGGVYLKKKNEMIDSLTRVENIATLHPIESYCKLANIKSKVPVYLIRLALKFFRAVYAEHKSEAIVLITFHNNKWGLYCPQQEVSMASLSYEIDSELGNRTAVGSIHSHGSFAAFHSNVDQEDEVTFDGLHITLGNVDDKEPSVSCSIISNGVRTILSLPDIVTEIEKNIKVPPYWLSKVKKKKWASYNYKQDNKSWWEKQEEYNKYQRSLYD